ncbi:MAG: nicotinate-nucleotide adenylyltransferase [Dysgonamonadaceae bacterium]|jgi:nicotinate-nucleotide adenylyltransferase|nr:nicotinate-nucleotide adenylyltransferase [Dysgonamonadaceae bacterium]
MGKKQIGIFPGSFNPIHIGHLVLANYLREFSYLDEIWFVVSPHNPLKSVGDLLDDSIRLEMVRLALKNFPDFRVSDVEFAMSRPSYTIDTLGKLSQENPDLEFTLIIGGDNWNGFHRWKDCECLRRKYKILIYPRLGEEIVIPPEFAKNIHQVNAPIVKISSTFIRESIREGKNMRAFVPPEVYDFIEAKGLYR